MQKPCPICGGNEFRSTRVLWPELVAAWELSQEEVDYIDKQQGYCCTRCGGNLRSMALASALLKSFSSSDTLETFCRKQAGRDLCVLEINAAGTLSALLATLPGHRLLAYPEFDLTKLAIDSGSADVVIHSDTLEHIEDAAKAMSECRRVLKPGGRCVFTVPVVVGRLTRSRAGLPATYHGAPGTTAEDLRVHTEFGADFWTTVIEAGFSTCSIHCIDYPGGIAVEARA